MKTRLLALLALVPTFALAAACEPELPEPKVPGPTTTHGDGDAGPLLAPPPTSTGPSKVSLREASAPVVAIRIAFASGSADDPSGKEGLTELAATTMAEGGTRELSYEDLVKKLYPMAASIDVNVDRDETVFSATVTRASLDAFYPMFRDVLLSPRMDADSFTRLKARQTSELVSELRGSDDETLGKEALQALLYENHPYGHPTIGTEHGLAASTLDDVVAHRKRVFCKDRALVGVAGGFPDGFDDLVAKDMADLPACDAKRVDLPAPAKHEGPRVLVVDKPSAQATAISIGFTTPVTRTNVADYAALTFATDDLGLHREFAGRLFQELREKRGLNYGDYAYSEWFEQAGYSRMPKTNIARRQQMVSIWLRPVKKANAPFALKGALYFTAKLVNGDVTDDEVARLRTYLTGYVGLQQQTVSRRLGYAMDDRAYGLPGPYLDVLRAQWKGLDAAKLKDAMKRLLATKDLSIAIVSPDAQGLVAELVKSEPVATPVYDSPKPVEVQSVDREIAGYPLGVKASDVKVVPVGQMFQ